MAEEAIYSSDLHHSDYHLVLQQQPKGTLDLQYSIVEVTWREDHHKQLKCSQQTKIKFLRNDTFGFEYEVV